MIGLSHGGGLNSRGTDADSLPSEQDTDHLGHSVSTHHADEGLPRSRMMSERCALLLDQPIITSHGEADESLLTLSETDTVFILSIDSCLVANDACDLETVKQSNERYAEVEVHGKGARSSDVNDLLLLIFSYARVGKEATCTVIVV